MQSSISVSIPGSNRKSMILNNNPGPSDYNNDCKLMRSRTPSQTFNKSDMGRRDARSQFLSNDGPPSPGPACYVTTTPKARTGGYTFFKVPKHQRLNSSYIGPGHYEVDSRNNTQVRR